MNCEVLDLRMRRTYKFLGDALYDLMLEKPFEQISVTDICRKAMVHRTTFYKHFEDKYQLLRMLFLEEAQKFEKIHLNDGETTKEYYRRVIFHMFEYVALYKDFFIQRVGNKENIFMANLLHTTISSYLKKSFQAAEEKTGQKEAVPIQIMAQFYTGAAIALIMWWIENDMRVSIEKMVDYMDMLIVS